MRTRGLFTCVLLLLLICALAFSACGNSDTDEGDCDHRFNKWSVTKEPTCSAKGIQSRSCKECGYEERQSLDPLGHDEVADPAVAATCTTGGKTAGAHCGDCGAVLTAQEVIPPLGHTEVADAAVAATCTTEGKTAGAHCSVCQTVIIEQTVIAATGHAYGEATVITEATCQGKGTKKYTCTATDCGHSYTEEYALATYTATEIYDSAVKYVGEIITYDRNGSEYALGTGFVISADGQVVTNYHVLEGAYSAKITIDGMTYRINSVLAYDKTIDLAVVKLSDFSFTAATLCSKPISVGETVYAVGSSRGMTNTCSQGIITYYNRVVDGVSHLQHDASITHGNSGGPLINAYGEVVGINTWGISDSQNLNFAVFVQELDNLSFGTPLTMQEFYEKECDPFTLMMNYIVANGDLQTTNEGSYYSVVLDTQYSSDYSSKYTFKAYYYVEDNDITLDLLVDDGDYWVYFIVDPEMSGAYYWHYFDDQYWMEGTLYASTFDENTLLGYSDHNVNYSSLRSSVRELASSMVQLICMSIDTNFQSIGVTAADLGFYEF